MSDTPGPLPAGQARAALVAAVGDGLTHLARGAAVVVACSGGADSTALAFLTAEARPDLALTIAHVRHGLRDDAADAALARQHASWLGVGHVEQAVEVVRGGQGVEAAARRARYGALRRVATDVGAAAILVGHTADDQAETVLLRLARGTGTDGLAAMQIVSGDLTRPMLRLRRDDVRRFVALEGLPYIDDPTNRDPDVRRALVRYEVLPRLAEVGPDPVGALGRLADLVRDDLIALRDAAEPLRAQVRWVGAAASVPTAALEAAPRSSAARVVRELLMTMCGQSPSAAVVARTLADGPRGSVALPGGVDVTRSGAWLTLSPRRSASSPARAVPDDGDVAWEPADRSLRVIAPASVTTDDEPGQQLPFDLVGTWVPPRVRVSATAVPPGGSAERLTLALPAGLAPLELRHRRPGDRIATMGGTKRVGDIAADAGLPVPLRALWPVLTSGESVIWMPGYAVDRTVAAQGRSAPARLLVLDVPPARTPTPDR